MNKTVAQQIAEKFDDDGQCFKNEAGETLDAECRKHQRRPDYRHGYGTDTYRFTFSDQSVMIISGDCWDYGYADCYCMQGTGHTEGCVGEGEPQYGKLSQDWISDSAANETEHSTIKDWIEAAGNYQSVEIDDDGSVWDGSGWLSQERIDELVSVIDRQQ